MTFFFNFSDLIRPCIGILDPLSTHLLNETKIILIKTVKCCQNMTCIAFYNYAIEIISIASLQTERYNI